MPQILEISLIIKLRQESITRGVQLWYWVNGKAFSFKRPSYLRIVSCCFFLQAKRWEGVHTRNRSAEDEQKRVCLPAKLSLLSLVRTCDVRDAIVIAIVEWRQSVSQYNVTKRFRWSSRVHWNLQDSGRWTWMPCSRSSLSALRFKSYFMI